MSEIFKIKTIFPFALISIFAFLFSLYFSDLHFQGDQVRYLEFWNLVNLEDFGNAALHQSTTTGSAEPGYRYVVLIGKLTGLPKNIFMSIINTIFLIIVFLLCRKYSANTLFTILLLVNFYILAMMFTLERLKISYLLILLGGLLLPRRSGAVLLSISPLFHFQALLLLAVPTSKFISKVIKEQKIKYIHVIVFCLMLLLLIITFMRNSETILYKVHFYALSEIDIYDYIKICSIAIVSIFLFKGDLSPLIFLFIMFVFIIIFGGSRVFVIVVTGFLYFAMHHRKTGSPIILAMMVYFSVTGFRYLINIYYTGSGYSGI